ncbi:MAG: glutathione peroxidase [Bdellovibrionia bacterium]
MNLKDFKVLNAQGQEVSLGDYAGKVVIVVNVASKCGFTPQYAGLEELYQKYKTQGLEILGFPCNQFGAQEPGSDSDIQSFCSLNYGVSFPVFKKIEVNGDSASPLYTWLKQSAPGILGTEMIKWNFTKFLINKKGEVVKRYAPQTTPADMSADIAAELQK